MHLKPLWMIVVSAVLHAACNAQEARRVLVFASEANVPRAAAKTTYERTLDPQRARAETLYVTMAERFQDRLHQGLLGCRLMAFGRFSRGSDRPANEELARMLDQTSSLRSAVIWLDYGNPTVPQMEFLVRYLEFTKSGQDTARPNYTVSQELLKEYFPISFAKTAPDLDEQVAAAANKAAKLLCDFETTR